MKRALGELGVPAEDVGLEAIPITQGWDPPPGNLDLTVSRTGDDGLWLAAELKLESVNETLWDVFKLTMASTMGGAEAGYLVVTAYERTWARSECRILFRPDDEVWTIRRKFSSRDVTTPTGTSWRRRTTRRGSKKCPCGLS